MQKEDTGQEEALIKPKIMDAKNQPNYEYVGKEQEEQNTKSKIPKQLIPTTRILAIMGFIFLGIMMLVLVQFPYGQLMSGKTDIIIEIGYPLHFLELGLTGNSNTTIQIKGLIIDLFLYIILAYIIDIIINTISKSKIIKSKEEEEAAPIVFKNQKATIADKITKKVFAKN